MKNFYIRSFLICLATLFFAFSVQANYLKNVPQKLKQPNGKVLNLYATGDEYYHWVHDEDGFTVIQNPTTGFICYAILNGEELIPSAYIVGEVSPSSVGLKPWINIPSWKINEIRDNFLNLERDYMIQKTGKYDGPVNVNSKGVINNIVVYIRFAGESEYTDNQSYFTSAFNDQTPGTLSMHNYYDEVSYNTLNITTSFLPINNGTQIISYQDSHPRNYFQEYNATTNPIGYQGGNSGSERTEREHTMLQSAINSVQGQLDPNLNIDNDGDGNVDNVCFIVQGTPGAWSSLLWPHKWQMHTKEAYLNDKRVWIYNLQIRSEFGVSVLCHEMFHSLGAPDLYHYTEGTPDPVGVWDLMNSDRAQHMTQFMKWRYGKWIDNIPEIATSGDYSLNPVFTKDNSCYKVKSPFSPAEYFVIEYRKKEKLDAVLPNEGLLIYRINTAVDGLGNRNGPPDELYVYRPDGSITSAGNLNAAPFSANLNKLSFNDKTNPDPFLSNGGIGGLNISNISSIGATMSFHIDIFNPLNVDAGATKILSPLSSSGLTSTEKIKVLLTNFGSSDISSGLKVNFKINGGTPVSQDFPLVLAKGSSVPFEFTELADFSNPGVYTLEIYTTYSGDQNTENDKITATIVNPIPIEYLAANASSTVGTYSEIATGTTIAVDNAKDGISAPITFPDGFTFKYCGTTYTQFILCTNGYIKLGDQNPSSKQLYFYEPQTADGGVFNSKDGADNSIIAPFAHDLVPGSGGAEYRVDISGTAPSRTVTIQYKNVRDNNAKMPNQYNSMNFQIKLYEGTNIIEFVYGLWTPSANASAFKTSLCGLRGLGNFPSQLLAVNKGSTGVWGQLTFTNGNYSTTATLNYGNTNGGARPAPEVGRVMRFVPTSGADVSIASVVSPISSCALGNFEPVTVKIKNVSGEPLSNIVLRYKVDAGNYVAESYNGTIAPFESVNYTFNQRADFSAGGNHNLVVQAVMAGDINTSNDSKTFVVTKIVPLALPFNESFEGTFPATGWSILNPDGITTWAQSSIAGNGGSTKAAFINFYDYANPSGQKDELVTPLIKLTGIPKLSFTYAYSTYPSATDSLAIYVITNCGLVQVKQPVFYSGGEALATAPTMDPKFIPSSPEQWKAITVDLSQYAGMEIQLKFVSINAYGNNLYIDDFEIKDYTVLTPVANFSANNTSTPAFAPVQFTDLSTGIPASWSWTFTGGTPATSTDQKPVVTYNEPGTYDVSLTVTNAQGTDSKTVTSYITVFPPLAAAIIPTVQTSTSANGRGPTTSVKYHRSSAIYKASEMGIFNNAKIRGIEYNIQAPAEKEVSGNIKIYMINTTDATFTKSTTWSTLITGMTLVYDGPMTIPAKTGYFGVKFPTPFTYTGSGVYVAFEWTISSTVATSAATYFCNSTGIANGQKNVQSAVAQQPTLSGTSNFRPGLRLSYEILENDASIAEVYSQGQIIAGEKHIVKAVVTNTGWRAITGKNITLDVTSGTTFNNVKAIDLAIGETKIVTFDEFTVGASGTNNIAISIPSDDNLTNNSKGITQSITTNVLSINPSTPVIAAGYGGTSTFAYLTKYKVNGTKTITKVSADIVNDPSNNGKVVYAIVVDPTTKSILGRSNNYTLTNLDLGVRVDFPIAMDVITDKEVLAGIVKATADAYYPFAMENESPLREGTYYVANSIADLSDLRDHRTSNIPYRFVNSITVGDPVAVTGLTVNPTSTSVEVGQKVTIAATIAPANATNKGVIWSSSDISIATVDNTGKVTGVSIGTVQIKATSNENATIFAESTVNVTAVVPVTSITLVKETTTITIGANETLLYTIDPANASNKNVVWSSSNTAVATVDAVGKVVAVSAGNADIKVKTVDGNFEDVCVVTVPAMLVATINVTPSTLSLYTTQTATLVASVLPANASNKAYDWTSSDNLVATVDATGKVTAVAAGTVEIRATAKDGSTVFGSCAVTVTAKVDLTGITLNQSTYNLSYDAVPPTSNYTLIATPVPANASVSAVTWSSQYPTVATVDATGKVIAVSIGTTVITATSVDNGTISATCTINVVPIAVTGITLSNATLSMNIGETKTISATAITPANATNKMVSWSSSDISKATVNALGVITAKASGPVNIIATSVSNPTVTQTCAVTVANAAVGSVSINKAYQEIALTSTYQLKATVFAATVPQVVDQSVTWTSSDNAKVSVDATGLVTGLIKDGTTVTITATSVADNSKTATAQIKVVQGVTSVTLDKHAKSIRSGQTFDIVATVNPTDADNKNISWSTSNPNIAIVNSSGQVTSIGSGIATITVTSQSDQTKSDACVVYVDNTAPIITLTGNATVEMTYGTNYTDAGATAADNVDGNITSSIIVTGLPTNVSPIGTYTVRYNVTDAAGNAAIEVTRTVNVVKATATISITNTTQQNNGTPRAVTVTTDPVGLNVEVKYTGTNVTYPESTTAPTGTGTYNVSVTINEANYTGSNTATLTITHNTAIDPNDINSVAIYSNSTTVFVKVPEVNGASTIEIFNILGNKVYMNANPLQGVNKIDENFSAGTYIVKVMVGNKVTTEKVVIK